MKLTVTSASEQPPYHLSGFYLKLMDYRKNSGKFDHVPPKRPKPSELGIELYPVDGRMSELFEEKPEVVLRISELGIEIRKNDITYFGQFRIIPIIPLNLAIDNDIDIPPGAAKIRVEKFHQIRPTPKGEEVAIDYPDTEEDCATLSATITQKK